MQILLFVALMWDYLPCPSIRRFVHSLVHFLLLLPIKTLNANDDMIFKCDSLVRILSLDMFMWACLLHPAITPFVHF